MASNEAFKGILHMRTKTLLLAACGLSVLTVTPVLADEAPDHGTKVSELVVTAAPYAVSLDTVTTSVNLVTREQLDVAPPAGLGDVLNGLPGLRSTFYGPGASRPVIRGLSGPRVLILQNGVGLVDASSLSPDHAVASEPGEATRIEVLRGPSTLAYGGSGIGGVVNVIDDRVPSVRPTNPVEGRISGSYSTVDEGGSVNGGLKLGKGPVVIALDAVHRKSEDYDVPSNPVSNRLAARDQVSPSPDGEVKNAGVEMDAYGAGISYVADNGAFIGVSAKRTDTTYGVPYPQLLPPDQDQEKVAIHLKQVRWDLRGESPVNLGPFDKARFSVGYADYQHAEVNVDAGEVGTRFLSDGTEGRFELVQREAGGHQGAVGAQGLTRHFAALGDEAFIPSVDIKEFGVFTLQRWDRGTWGVDAGLRVDQRKLEADLTSRPNSAPAQAAGVDWSKADRNQTFTNVSASVGVFWKPVQDVFWALSLSHNSRAPTEFELFADGPHGGTSSYELGNPNFSEEKVNSLEATFRYTPTHGRVEAHLYGARYDGFIEEVPTGAVEDGLPVFQYRQTDATFHGAELEATYDVWHPGEGVLAVGGMADWVRGDTDQGAPARIPPYSVAMNLTWASPAYDARLEVRHVGEQDRVATRELPTDAYTLVNASASWKPPGQSGLKLFVDARNLTDQQAREHTSFLKDIAPLPGRSLRVGAAYSF